MKGGDGEKRWGKGGRRKTKVLSEQYEEGVGTCDHLSY